MDPMTRVRNYLLDNVGHMTYPGNPSFDPATQFLVWKKSDNAVPVYVKNERSLRVAVHCNLLDNPSQQEIVFSVIEGKDFLFLFFLNHISSHPARR